MTVTISVDAMGGDHGLPVTIPATLNILRDYSDCNVRLVGIPDQIEQFLKKIPSDYRNRITIVAATEVVAMDDPIEISLRKKKDSSMRIAIEQVKSGLADVAVSAGNTGALMAISRYVLKTMEGIDRPAIAAQMPNEKGEGTTILDLGANSDCEASHLLQFALMADVMVRVIDGKENPSIGLLNIGEEVIKGNETVKQAGELLRASKLNFYGNVEGNDIFKGTTDIVVCDGFVGNVALKTSEGLASMISGMIKQEFNRSIFTKLLAFFALPILLRFRKRVDHRQYNGAVLLGLKGLVLKSHGSADRHAFYIAMTKAYEAAKNNMVSRIAEAFGVSQQSSLESVVSTPTNMKEAV
ncbi:MAG: phosphate acyltransferase PlsX [Betaproteobacteria bacterium]|jgi:glycerol-3-phosphate acyltransferase PlsX